MKRRPLENAPTGIAATRFAIRAARSVPRLLGVRRAGLPDQGFHLFVAPEGGISVFTETHYRLASLLRARGGAVAGIFCHGAFPRCPVMEMRRVPYSVRSLQRRLYCLHCAATTHSMAREFGIPLIDLRRWPISELRSSAQRVVAGYQGEFLEFEHDGIAFGKLAAMDLVLATKRAQLKSPPADVRHKWASFVEASVFSYLLFSRVCAELPVLSVTHFNDYSVMLGARLAAERRGLPVFSITQASHLNSDNRRILVRREIGPTHGWRQLDRWPAVRDVPLLPDEVSDVCDDILVRLQATGSHTFSPAKTRDAKDLHYKLRLCSDRKLIVAYTSSLDERHATTMTTLGAGRSVPAVREIFTNQIEWLRFLADHVSGSTDLQLVVRVHPREGAGGAAARAGKILAVESEHLGLLRHAFPHDPPNCRIVWPDDDVSSYDLAEIADAAAVSWSTIGLELARLAVPVVGCVLGYGPYVNDDFTVIPQTPEEYKEALRSATAGAVCPARWARALRFYHHYFLGTALDVRACVDANGCLREDSFLTKSDAATACDEIMAKGREISLFPHGLTDKRPCGAVAEERAALVDCAQRLIGFFGYDAESALADVGAGSLTPMVARFYQLATCLEADAGKAVPVAGSAS